MKRFGNWTGMAVLAGMILSAGAARAENATYYATWTAPRCTSGYSPCHVPASLINSRSFYLFPEEPNQPNTLAASTCADGTSGTYHVDESLDGYTVGGVSGVLINAGDTVRLNANVWCYSPADVLSVYRSDSATSPAWTLVGQTNCTVSLQPQTLTLTFNLGTAVGYQAIRAQVTYGAVTSACTAGGYNDRDDLALNVIPVDQDGDGMPSEWEYKYMACVNRTVADAGLDPDKDALTNIQEYQNNTNPCVADTDNGGELDGFEVSAGRNPLRGFDDHVVNTIGTGTGGWALPIYTAYEDDRAQIIYLASEIAPAANLSGLIESVALDVSTAPGPVMNNFTIRMKHTALSSYSTYSWESTGWTTVYQANQSITATGWHIFKFQTPFYWNGYDNVMVDMSFNNSTTGAAGFCHYTNTVSSTRSIYYYTNSGYC